MMKLSYCIKRFYRLRCNEYRAYSTVKWFSPTGISTDLSIYNVVIKQKVPFIIDSNDFVSWYVCGPTVYDFTHIGHAWFDIMRRIIEKYLNKTVIQVMCITDIDDKIIKKSEKCNLNWKVLVNIYEKEFHKDLNALNVIKPVIVARATDFIPQMIQFIRRLIDINLAYQTSDGSVYFDSQKYGKCGKLKINVESKISNLSESLLMHKKCIADFALWKGVKQEPYWIAPWGSGRPGWHIECSTIASEYFGNSVDIHSGGIDLLFPHHENEESQCCAFYGIDQWVNYWIHTGHLHVSSEEKMSKSYGKTITVQEFLKSHSADLLRMICLSHNYYSNIEYNEDLLKSSLALCHKFIDFFNDCQSYINGCYQNGNIDSSRLWQALKETQMKVQAALLDNFDTPTCLSVVTDLVSLTHSMINCKMGNRCTISVSAVYIYVVDFLNSVGLKLTGSATAKLEGANNDSKFENLVESSLNYRSDVRDVALLLLAIKKNGTEEIAEDLLKLCNNFREELRALGVIVKDRKQKANIIKKFNELKKDSEKKL